MRTLHNGWFSGMRAFWLVWFGQVVSLLGSGMTGFALTIWVYQLTGSATALALMGIFYTTPMVLLMPLVGVMVDRYDRKLMMMVSDLAAGVVTIALFVLYIGGGLQVWHLYAAGLFGGIFGGFQRPAFDASITLMVGKEHYVRANSMIEVMGAGSGILAPILAGALLGLAEGAGFDGLRLILLIDIITFSAAVGTLLLIHVPNPPRTEEKTDSAKPGFWQELRYGVRYIAERPPLLILIMGFTVGNLLATLGGNTLTTPMILARTGSNEWIYGITQAVGSIGYLLGGVIVGAWGGFKRRVYGVLLAWALFPLFTGVMVGLGRPEPAWMMALWVLGGALGVMVVPLANGSVRAIIQSKSDPGVQGRIITSLRFIAWITIPVAQLISGTLADRVAEPAMQSDTVLRTIFAPIVGTGPGAGMSVIILIAGVLGVLFAGIMALIPAVRHVEKLLPDRIPAETPTIEPEVIPA